MMTRRSTLILVMLALGTLSASAQTPAGTTVSPSVAALRLPPVGDLPAAGLQVAPQAPRQGQPPPPPPPPDIPRRRGSMVGYLEDPVVSSKVRIRLDAGWHNPAPDRAEFFYAKCGCYANDPTDPAYDPDAPGPGPGAASDVNFKQLYVLGEVAPTDHFSVFAELPVRWLQPQAFVPGTGAPFENQSGIADVRAGARFGLSAEPGQALTAQVKVFIPTGDAAKGLGTDHWSIEPAFLVYRELSPTVAVEGQIAAWAPFGGAKGIPASSDDKFAGRVVSYGVGPSVVVFESARTRIAPVVELVGWHVIGGFQTPPPGPAAADTVNLKVGGRVNWNAASGSLNSLYVGFGHALTDAKWYEDILRIEYRWSF